MKEDFILPVCPNENFAGALSSSDRWVTEVQCLPSQGEPGCQNGVQKRGLQGEKPPVSAAVCTILVHCSPGNPARKLQQWKRRVGGRWWSFYEAGFPCHTAKLSCRQSLLPAELQWPPLAEVSGRVTEIHQQSCVGTLTHGFKAAAF